MYWNYRIVRKPCSFTGEHYYGIHECYYEDDGSKPGWTVEPVEVIGESVDELRRTLEMMKEAFAKPVIEDDDADV